MKSRFFLPCRAKLAVGWALFFAASSIYLLTFRGLFRSVDELALFSVAESLIQTHSTDTSQLGFAAYHNRVGRLEVLHPALAAPLYRIAVASERLGNIQTTMLLSVWLTATTCAVVYGLLMETGHAPAHALLVSAAYGLATLAWPYSRTFFREPLLSLLVALAAWSYARWYRTGVWAWGAVTAVCLALNVGAKVTMVLVWPAFGLAFVFRSGLTREQRQRVLATVLVLGAAGGGAAMAVYAARTGNRPLGVIRFLAGLARPGELLARAFGLTLGAGRGLFVFSPVLLLCVPGTVLLWRRHRALALLSACSFAFIVLGYSLYRDWHGGMSWGPRFLVPVLPLLTLPLAEWLTVRRSWVRVLSVALLALSFFLQLASASADYSLQVEDRAWENQFDYARSPAVRQVGLWRPENLDVVWWRGAASIYGDQPEWTLEIAMSLGASLLASLGWLVACARRLRWTGLARRTWPWAVGAISLHGMAVVVLALRAPAAIGGYPGVDPAEVRAVAQTVNVGPQPQVIVTVSNDFHFNVLLDSLRGRFIHHWLSPEQSSGFEPLLEPPWPARGLHLIVDRVHLPPEHSGRDAELWLNAHLYRYQAEWIGSGYEVYSYLYPPDEMPEVRADQRWEAGMRLLSYGITPRTLSPGAPVWVALRLSAWQALATDYDLFVQLLAPDGRFVNGTDGPPQFGASPTSDWTPDREVVDRRAVYVPGDAAPGAYRLVAGFYRGSKRQALVDRAGRVVGTRVELGEVRVRE